MPDAQAIKNSLHLEPIDPPSKTKGRGKSDAKTKSDGKSKTRSRPTDLNITEIKKALRTQIELIGTLTLGLDAYDGQVIIDHADDLADSLIELAKANKTVRAFLERMIAAGAWSGVITVLIGEMAIPIAVHHNAFPEPLNAFMAEVKDIPVKDKRNGTDKENVQDDRIENLQAQANR